MARKDRRRKDRRRRASRGRLGALIAIGIFAFLATLPLTLSALNLHILPVAAKTSYGITLVLSS